MEQGVFAWHWIKGDIRHQETDVSWVVLYKKYTDSELINWPVWLMRVSWSQEDQKSRHTITEKYDSLEKEHMTRHQKHSISVDEQKSLRGSWFSCSGQNNLSFLCCVNQSAKESLLHLRKWYENKDDHNFLLSNKGVLKEKNSIFPWSQGKTFDFQKPRELN